MNREKYINNNDYREGYDEGTKNGKLQAIAEMEEYIKTLHLAFDELSKKAKETI